MFQLRNCYIVRSVSCRMILLFIQKQVLNKINQRCSRIFFLTLIQLQMMDMDLLLVTPSPPMATAMPMVSRHQEEEGNSLLDRVVTRANFQYDY